jgi:hypothetical protein
MPAMNIPIRYSSSEAKSIIAQKLKDKTLSVGERRKLEDQYQEYAKGGDVKALKAKKVGKVMHEFKTKSLHSGKGGPVVKNPKQAIAIALSEASRATSKKKKK